MTRRRRRSRDVTARQHSPSAAMPAAECRRWEWRKSRCSAHQPAMTRPGAQRRPVRPGRCACCGRCRRHAQAPHPFPQRRRCSTCMLATSRVPPSCMAPPLAHATTHAPARASGSVGPVMVAGWRSAQSCPPPVHAAALHSSGRAWQTRNEVSSVPVTLHLKLWLQVRVHTGRQCNRRESV